ncbi:hypothetical protein NPC53_001525 [Shigella flexneri]|nr:hypothetical protein [Shigella flexneri]
MKKAMGLLLRKSGRLFKDMVLLQRKKRENSEEWQRVTKKVFEDLIAMGKEFELERKYLVLSLEDINLYLDESQKRSLEILVNELKREREDLGDEPLEGIFVNKSYPFYEETLKKLEMYVKQQNRKEISMVSLGGQQMLFAEDINPSRVNRGVCIKITGREEFLSKADLEGFCTGFGSVFNGNRYHIQCFPIKGHAIMLQIRESHNGDTHFFHTTTPAIQAVIENLC